MVEAPYFESARPPSIDLQRVDPLKNENWDELLLAQPAATVFHSRAWAQVLAASYRFKPEYFVAEDEGRLLALLPLFEVRSWLTGVRGVSLPFTDRCDPLGSRELPITSLLHAAQELGRERQWSYFELRGAPGDIPEASTQFYQHDLDLTRSGEDLFDGCESAMRRAIRKAEKEKVRIECRTDPEAMERYYRLHRLTRQKHGIPPQPIKFFRNIHRFIVAPGYGTVVLALLNDRAVAGAVFFHFGQTSTYKFGASDPAFQDARSNNLLLWRGLLKMKELGAQTLSFGRTSLVQDGLRRFKLAFGARETMLRYIRFNFRSNKFETEQRDRSTGVHASIFRYCPRPLARLAGAMIYPHIG